MSLPIELSDPSSSESDSDSETDIINFKKNTSKSLNSSEQSLNVTASSSTTSEEEGFYYQIMKLQTILEKILNDKQNTFSHKSEDLLDSFTDTLDQLFNRSISLDEKIKKQSDQIKSQQQEILDLQETIQKIESSRPKLQALVKKALQQHMDQLQEIAQTIVSCSKEAQNTIETIKTESAKQTTSQQMQMYQSHFPPLPTKHIENPITRRTVLVKTKSGNSGEEITKLLREQKVDIPPKTIRRICKRNNYLEIRCPDEESTKQIKSSLEQHQSLKDLLMEIKPTTLSKMILLGVPEAYEPETLQTLLTNTFGLKDKECQILVHRESPIKGLENWILLLPRVISQHIINEGGIVLRFQQCRLRPFTSVPRCRNCQSFTHTTQRCRSDSPNCETCAEHHTKTNCCNAARCINCEYSNKHNGTTFDTTHKASDSKCPAYWRRYTEERLRLNNLFNLPNPTQSNVTPTQDLPSRNEPQISELEQGNATGESTQNATKDTSNSVKVTSKPTKSLRESLQHSPQPIELTIQKNKDNTLLCLGKSQRNQSKKARSKRKC